MKVTFIISFLSTTLSRSSSAVRLGGTKENTSRRLQQQNIVEIASGASDFSTLVEILTTLDLDDALSGPGPFTVFAPTNSAFDALISSLPAGGLELITNSGELEDIVKYHVIGGAAVPSTDLVAFDDILTLEGSEVKATNLSPVTINYRSEVVAPDIVASNGIIHAIDKVLLPRSANLYKNVFQLLYDDPDLNTLKDFVLFLGFLKPFVNDGPFTIFAPSNDAFKALIETLPSEGPGSFSDLRESGKITEILKYHIVPGAPVLSSTLVDGQTAVTSQGSDIAVAIKDGSVKINDSTVIGADILGANGVIHKIDTVLIPPGILPEPTPEKNIVEIAVELAQNVEEPEFTTLVELVLRAGLEVTLSSFSEVTLFAPTDLAFAALPNGTLESLSNEDIVDILTYHVIAGATILSTDLSVGLTAATVQGQNVNVTSVDPYVINESQVILPDVLANNGVIHVIDSVLIP